VSGGIGSLPPDDDSRNEEREHLLVSLEDLDREHDAGDLSDQDYEELRAEYTARAAELLKGEDSNFETSGLAAQPEDSGSRRRAAAWLVVVLVIASLSGVALARGVGQRGGGGLTGDAGSLRERLAACQPLAFQQPKKGVGCYQKILNDAPDDLDALTYQGWALVRDGRPAEGARNFARVVELDPDYPDVRVFRAVLAARAEKWPEAAAEIERFYANNPPPVAVQVLRTEGLEFKIFIGLQPAATKACWVDAAKGLDPKVGFDQPFIDRLAKCLDGVLRATPVDPDARFSRALASIGPERQDTATAGAIVDRLLLENPKNANALLLRSRLLFADGKVQEAAAGSAALSKLPHPSAAFLLGEPKDLEDAVRQARSAAASSTTTLPNASVSSIAGSPALPNPGGG